MTTISPLHIEYSFCVWCDAKTNLNEVFLVLKLFFINKREKLQTKRMIITDT